MRNRALRKSSTKDSLLQQYGHLKLLMRAPNRYTRDYMALADYISQVVDGSPNQTKYWFGDTFGPDWRKLYSLHKPPERVLDLLIESEQVTKSIAMFGVAGPGSGAPFHAHGAALAEVVHGSKKWFLYPPRAELPGVFNGQSVASWVTHVLPTLAKEQTPQHCELRQGDILYVPNGWYHATLNTAAYNVFISSFTDESGHSGHRDKKPDLDAMQQCDQAMEACQEDEHCKRFLKCVQLENPGQCEAELSQFPTSLELLQRTGVCDNQE